MSMFLSLSSNAIPRRMLTCLGVSLVAALPVVHATPGSAVENPAPVVRMAAGTTPVTDASGNVWSERSATLGTTNLSSALVGKDVRGTADDVLYQRNAWGAKGFSTPVPTPGTYRVRLLMAEDYWWSAGQRVFDVTAEGGVVAKDVDIFRAVGKGAAYDLTFDTVVNDGRLDLSFIKKVDNPLVSAIEVTPVPAPQPDAAFDVRMTARTADLTYGGETWSAGRGWTGPVTISDLGAAPIGSTDDDPLFRTQISGVTGWSTAVPEPGTYRVQLFLAEDSVNQVGQRVFDVTAEGQTALAGVDPFKAAGVRTAYTPSFEVPVSDGRLDLGFVATVGTPSIAAIRVTRASDTSPATPSVPQTTGPAPAATASPAPTSGDVTSAKSIFVSRMGTKRAAYTDSAGRTWSALTSGMGSWRRSSVLEGSALPGTTTPEAYTTNVYGSAGYTLPVSADPAVYHVRLLMAEDYWKEPGRRVFDVRAEGATVAQNVDIVAAVGARRPYDITFDTTVRDGMLDLDFVKRVDLPLISGIELVSDAPVAPVVDGPRRILPVAPDSFWTEDISSAPTDPDSAAKATALKADVDSRYGGTAGFNAYQYSVGYHTPAPGTRYVTVDRSCGGTGWTPGVYDGAAHFLDVPVPADGVAAVGSDANMSIYDATTDRYWSFWQMRKNPDTGRWSACWGGRIDNLSKSQGIFPSGFGAAASGLPLAPGMVTQDEVRRGRIDHAVAIVLPTTRQGDFSWPANRTDGNSTASTAIMEGQRLRLDPTLDLSAYDMSPLGRMIAKAAQKYGMIPVDTGGGVAVLAQAGDREEATTGVNPWNALIGDRHWDVMRNFPWDKVQVLPKDYGRR